MPERYERVPGCLRCGAKPEFLIRVWDAARNESVFLCGPCSTDRAIVRRCSCCAGSGLLFTMRAGSMVEPVTDPGASNGR